MTSAAFPSVVSGAVLVASPNRQVRNQVLQKLDRRAPIYMASGGAEALAKLENGKWQVLFLDRRLPDLDAEELVAIIERRYPGIRVVLVDSSGPETDSCEPELGFATTQALSSAIAPKLSSDFSLPGMIGDSEPMKKLYRMARLVAPRDTTVLITGPTGSGKELVARAIHQLSTRSAQAFVVLNCAAIPETLVESELFGYCRGAFTGAAQTYSGRIVAAQGGTLFLDEIGELPLVAQSKLLRFLEHKEVQRLGSAEITKADVRVVAATNCNLAKAVPEGTFRSDLYFRLSAFPLRLAPLAQRKADILKLAAYLLQRRGNGADRLTLARSAGEKLEAYAWPGNVREMQQVLERAAIVVGEGRVILPEHIVFSTSDELEEAF